MTGTRTRGLELGPGRSVEVTLTEAGTGRTALVLHGGGGPATVQSIAAHLSGTARFTVGDTSYDAAAGTLVMVPPGAPHTFANPGEVPVVLLNTFTPDLYVRYFRDLRQMIADGQPLTPESTERAMRRYATETAADYAERAR